MTMRTPILALMLPLGSLTLLATACGDDGASPDGSGGSTGSAETSSTTGTGTTGTAQGSTGAGGDPGAGGGATTSTGGAGPGAGGSGDGGGGGGAGAVCDTSDAAPVGVATFFPDGGGAAIDVTASLDGASGSWTGPGSGTLRLCGGAWTGAVSAGAADALVLESHPSHRATLTGVVTVSGEVQVRDLDVVGRFHAQGGSVEAPTGTLSLDDVAVDAPAGTTMFDGAMVLTVTASALSTEGVLLRGSAGMSLLDTTVVAASGYEGANPLLYGASLVLDGVTARMGVRGFTCGPAGSCTVTRSALTSEGPGEVLLVSTPSYTIEDTVFTSDYAGADALPLLQLIPAATAMTDLEFVLRGHRGAIRATTGVACTRCAFSEPALQPAIEITSTTGGLSLTDCELVGLAGAPVSTMQGFVVSQANGAHNVVGSTFTGGYRGDGGGAAIHVIRGALTITGSTFTGNIATGGGGAVRMGQNGSTVTTLIVSGSTFVGNSSSDQGGAVWTVNPLSITTSSFENNEAVLGGGAVFSGSTTNTTVSDASFLGNDGGVGGGAIVYRRDATNSLIVTSSDFGDGLDDNALFDVHAQLPLGSLGSPTLEAGAGATFTCNASCL